MSLEEATGGYIMSLQNQAMGLRAENARLRRALALILAHADAGDKAPPIRFSVRECGRIAGILRGEG